MSPETENDRLDGSAYTTKEEAGAKKTTAPARAMRRPKI